MNLETLMQLKEKLNSHVDKMRNDMDSINWEYDSKYDIAIKVDGKEFNLELHADLYEGLTTLIDEQIRQESE